MDLVVAPTTDRYQARLQKLEEMHAAVAVARGTIERCLRIADVLDSDHEVMLSANPRVSRGKGDFLEFPLTIDRPARATLAAELRLMARRIEQETVEVEQSLAIALGLDPQPPETPPAAA